MGFTMWKVTNFSDTSDTQYFLDVDLKDYFKLEDGFLAYLHDNPHGQEVLINRTRMSLARYLLAIDEAIAHGSLDDARLYHKLLNACQIEMQQIIRSMHKSPEAIKELQRFIDNIGPKLFELAASGDFTAAQKECIEYAIQLHCDKLPKRVNEDEGLVDYPLHALDRPKPKIPPKKEELVFDKKPEPPKPKKDQYDRYKDPRDRKKI